MGSTYDELNERLQLAYDTLEVGADPVLRRSDRVDFQSNGAMALAKRLDRVPRDVAEDIVARANLEEMATLEVAGPGFINVTLENGYLARRLDLILADERLGVAPVASPHEVVIDYSAPNVAKEMHVGNLRSTVIGDAIRRHYEFAGHHVIARNHVGDWGTPFGMLIENLVDLGESQALTSLSMGDLDTFYRQARVKFDTDDDFAERSRRRVVLLQGGDAATLRWWQMLVDASVRYLDELYRRLDIELSTTDVVGESYYNDELERVVADLDAAGLLVKDGGALCVFPPGFTNRDGDPLPLIVQKSDDGFGYAATDLAAIRDRVEVLGADEILYFVGATQSQHFEMVFATARMAGWLPERVRCEHVTFGNVLGPDRKMYRSRAGGTVRLVDLLDEAVTAAADELARREVGYSADERSTLSYVVARAAIKYSDLSGERTRDYVFDLDRMTSFEGDTGPYLCYAHARVRSIFRRLDAPFEPAAATFTLAHPAERDLALGLLEFPDAFALSLDNLLPHKLCGYLFDLAQRFTTFYENCPVLNADPAERDERLALCDLTSRTLALGLSLLGISAPERM